MAPQLIFGILFISIFPKNAHAVTCRDKKFDIPELLQPPDYEMWVNFSDLKNW